MQKNRAFENMRKTALERLMGRDPVEIQKNTGIVFVPETSEFRLISMGQNITVTWPEYRIKPELNQWHHLAVLHYMDMADGSSLTCELMSFGELPGGMVRVGGFDRLCEQTVSHSLGDRSESAVKEICRTLGGKTISCNADLGIVFPFLPYYPITLKIWFADEEIAGTGRMFLDRSAGHFLSVEDAVTVGTLLLEEIVKKYKRYCSVVY